MSRPPRVADALLRRCLPSGATGLAILGDLREEYRARSERGESARWWYWREALLLAGRYLTTRGASSGPRARRAWTLSNDVRTAFRALHRNAATSFIIVLTLGAALGASTIGFTFADLSILRGLPVVHPEAVVGVYGVDVRQSDGRARLALANYRDLKMRTTTLESFTAFQAGRATLIDRGIPISLSATRATPEFFDMMGIGAAAGRVFRQGDDQPGQLGVVLAHHYWQRVHNADERVIGTSLLIGGRSHTVVGVASPELEFGNLANTDLWLPLEIGAMASRTERTATTMGRLRAGVSVEAARAELTALGASLAAEYPEENRDWKITVLPIREVAFGRGFWVVITLFLASVALIMVIACANAASLVLARALARRREIALRSALGAGRWRLLRQALIEGLFLSIASAAFALPLAESALRVIKSLDSEPTIQQLVLDWHEIGFVAVVALLTPMLFSVLPTLSAVRLDIRAALQSGGTRAGVTGNRSRTVLVGVQLALAVAILTTAGLAVRTGVNLTTIEYGMRTSEALLFAVDLDNPEARVDDPHRFLDEMRGRLQRIPGIEGVHAFQAMPVLSGERVASIDIDGQPAATADVRPWAFHNAADAGALAALKVPLVAGRWIEHAEEERRARVVLVGEETARRYFGSSEGAVGRRLLLSDQRPPVGLEIVGVVGDVLVNDVERGKVPRIWTTLADARRLNVVVTTRGSQDELASLVRREMASLAPAIPLEQLETIDRAFAHFEASNQIVIGIFAGFAVLAVLLAASGLYGLITYTVSQRTSEFGTRFALGARRGDVLRLVLAQVGRLTGVGLAMGMLGGLAGGYGMRGILFGVSSTDPVTIGGVIAVVALVALIASIRPAMRAARVNLVEALRSE